MFSFFKKSHEATSQETKLISLVALYIFCVIMTETLGVKTSPVGNISLHFGPINIPQLKVSMAIFFIPFIYCINDILAQVWGYKTARTVYRISLFSIVGLAFFSWLSTSLPASMIFVDKEAAFDTIFGQTIRFSLASITAFAVSDILDVIIFCRLRDKFRGKSLWLSTNLSNFIAQGIDGALFVYLAMYVPGDISFWAGNHAFMWGVILPYWVFRCCMSVFATPFVYAGVKWAKQ
jgi:queuosine precursor transporter